MAANINLHQPRMEHALTEHDDNNGEPTTPDGQTPSQSNTNTAALTDQQGNSASDGSGSGSNNDAGANESYTPAPPPPEESIPLPAQFRYGVGDTVIMGRPDYTRAYADRAEPSAGKPSSRETAFAPVPRAENTPASAGTATTVKPTPMPKPGGNLSPAPALISSELAPAPAPALTHNAPQIEGASVAAPAATTSTTPSGSDLAFEQGMADLTLGDPLNQELIARYDQEHPGANFVEHSNAVADHLVATYGEARLNDMAKLHQALAGVRDDYTKALTAAEARGPSFGNTSFWKSSSGSSGDGGTEAPVFDNEAFTRWYIEQDGLSNRAFAANYAYGVVSSVTHSQGDNTQRGQVSSFA
jgi:hypothetical protein